MPAPTQTRDLALAIVYDAAANDGNRLVALQGWRVLVKPGAYLLLQGSGHLGRGRADVQAVVVGLRPQPLQRRAAVGPRLAVEQRALLGATLVARIAVLARLRTEAVVVQPGHGRAAVAALTLGRRVGDGVPDQAVELGLRALLLLGAFGAQAANQRAVAKLATGIAANPPSPTRGPWPGHVPPAFGRAVRPGVRAPGTGSSAAPACPPPTAGQSTTPRPGAWRVASASGCGRCATPASAGRARRWSRWSLQALYPMDVQTCDHKSPWACASTMIP